MEKFPQKNNLLEGIRPQNNFESTGDKEKSATTNNSNGGNKGGEILVTDM